MKHLKNTIIEAIILFGTCGLLLALYNKGILTNVFLGTEKAIPGILSILGLGAIFVTLIMYLKHIEMKNNPEFREIIEINNTDERKIYLKDKANSKTYAIFDIIEVPICLILLFTGFDELGVGLMIFHFMKQIIRSLIHSKLLKEY